MFDITQDEDVIRPLLPEHDSHTCIQNISFSVFIVAGHGLICLHTSMPRTNRWVGAILLQVPIHCIDTYNNIALTRRNVQDQQAT